MSKIAGATKEQALRMKQLTREFRSVAEMLHLHPDTSIRLRFDPLGGTEPGDPMDEQWLMQVDQERGDYMRWTVGVSPRCLVPERDYARLADVIHECLHMLLYEYTGLAESLASGKAVAGLRGREERVVTLLERSIFDLARGRQDG